MFLKASGTVNPFQKVFNQLCPGPSLSVAATAFLTKCISYILRLESPSYSFTSGLQNGCCVRRCESIHLVSISSELLCDQPSCR